MTQKYYHNDYKKMMGLDQTRTASEKLLDKAIGGVKKAPETVVKPVQKKVKQENISLTHSEVLNKLIKNIEGNKNAVKVLKPLSILKKCLNDQAFNSSAEINTLQQWNSLISLLIEADSNLNGNYSEVGLVIDCLAQIFQRLLCLLKKMRGQGQNTKEQQQEVAVKRQQTTLQEKNRLNQAIQITEIHLIFLKMFTDDSFSFNKLLLQFKTKFYGYFQQKLNGKSQKRSKLYEYLQRLLLKLFSLPHSKYEWARTSLAHFLKEFNISYKHAMKQEQMNIYLKAYNQFINHKAARGAGESVNIFGTSSKGAKVATIQMGPSDGVDKWTSKQ